jgi:hypothetical protein
MAFMTHRCELWTGASADAQGREHDGDHAWHYKQWENPSHMNPALDMPTSANRHFCMANN